MSVLKNSGQNNNGGRGEVILAGALKKLKTARKKWFVLRAGDDTAALEYYDSERKYKNGLPPKRAIPLKTCFNINRRNDTKYRHVIALYTKDDCFCVILDNEEDLDTWLKALLSLQRRSDENADGEFPRPTFEHVWQVAILNRGLGTGRTGNYRLCLTDKTLCLIKTDCNRSIIDLKLSNIRSCGSLKNYFYLEIGRSSLLGAGELWMDTEDANIAQNVHTTIFDAMKKNGPREPRDELAPTIRIRSSSATEASKPNNNVRRNNSTIPKPYNFTQGPPMMGGRERCDSMPSRARTTSDGSHPIPGAPRSYLKPYRSQGRDISHSPPSGGSPVSPPSVGCSTDSAGSSYSLTDEADMCPECTDGGAGMRYTVPLTPDEAIAEEECPYGGCDSYMQMGGGAPASSDDGYVDMSPRCRHGGANSPTISLASVTSGTPSTDLRFCDYPLDKVSSYFPSSSEDDTRQNRSYSVGSRPETYRNKRHVELAGTPENSRVRAFSVGSKSKKMPARVLPPHHSHQGKSSSAPILPISKTHSSHSSIGPMEDLMEMDFSRSSSHNLHESEPSPRRATSNSSSGYVEMKPGVDPLHKNSTVDTSCYVDMTGSSYVDMSGTSPSSSSGGRGVQTQQQQPKYSSFVDINRQYGLTHNSDQPTRSCYMDMDQRRRRLASTSSSNGNANHALPSTSPGSNNSACDDYLDMSGSQSSRLQQQQHVSVSPPTGCGDYAPMGFSQQQQQMERSRSDSQSKTPEGYVEMTVRSSGGHRRQSSYDGAQLNNGDSYANMSLGSGQASSGKKKQTRKEKTVSQPIYIYPNNAAATGTASKGSSSGSPLSVSSLLGRKSSGGGGGTPPRAMHLPLSPYSSLSLERRRNRKDSPHSGGGSAGSSATTPSNSSAIFPLSLNSPSSPLKPPSKAETPVAFKVPAAILNAFHKSRQQQQAVPPPRCPVANDDYTVMDFEDRTKPALVTPAAADANNRSDYANFSAGRLQEQESDYVPIEPQRGGRLSLTEHQLSSLNIYDTHFRPIAAESSLQKGGKDLKDDSSQSSSNSAYVPFEALRGSDPPKTASPCPTDTSRPSSVTSELSKGPPSRPSSTSSELWSTSSTLTSCNATEASDPPEAESGGPKQPDNRLHYASLDLPQEEETQSSPRAAANAGQSQGEPTFVYAEIDFVKSEGLKQTGGCQSLASGASKVKHV